MTDNSDIDYDKLADSIISRLQSLGVSRRDMLTVLAGGGAGALAMGAASPASAQQINGIIKADQLGTSSEPVQQLYVQNETTYENSEAIGTLTVDTLNSADVSDTQTAERALETDGSGNLNPVAAVTDGDGTKREIWVIANGASDPAGADPEDIILEEA
jgi:hypothetical protein